MIAHSTPQVFFAYAPQGAGLRCAMFYFAAGDDLWGWFTGPQDGLLVTDYFHVAGFHAPDEPRYAAVDIAGLHCGWAENRAMCAELARLQSEFVREWLFYCSAKDARAQLRAYHRAGLPAGEVNLRFDHLAKLARTQPTWTYFSPGFEPAVLAWLAGRWPLDYRASSAPALELDDAALAVPG